MRLIWVIFVFVLSFDQLVARSITNKRSTSSFDTSFFDNFHQLFGFYEVPPPKSDSTLGPANPSDVVPESPQPSSAGVEVPQPTQPAPVEPQPSQPSQPAPTEPQHVPAVPQPTQPVPTEPQHVPVVLQPTQPAPVEPQPSQPAPTEPQSIQFAPAEHNPSNPAPAIPQPAQPVPAFPQPAPVEPSPSVPQSSQPLPIQPAPIVAQSKPVQSSPVAPPPVQAAPRVPQPVQATPLVPQPSLPVVVQPDTVQVHIQPLSPQPGEPVNLRNFDPVASVAQPHVQPQPAQPPVQLHPVQPFVQPQPAVQPPLHPQPSFQPPVQPQPAQPSFQPSVQPQPSFQPPVQPQPTQPSFQPPVQPQPSFQPTVQPQAAQPPIQPQPVQPLPAQPPVQSQPLLPNPLVSQPTSPAVNQPVQPSISVPPVQPNKPVLPALPNKPSTHQGWTGAPQRQPYYGPPRPFGPQPWWRQPSPIPSIPQNLNGSHPSQPKYVSSDTAIPNKNKDIKVGIPNKTPDLRPARPLPPFHMEPSPFPLPREECITAQGELGECASYFSCGQLGGRPRGLCHLGHDVSSHARTCCVYPSFCGYQTNREVTYFKNPNYPNVTSHLGDCLYRVNLLPGVCQVRVDFMDFLMKPMKNGDCEQENSLRVTSNDENSYIPVDRFCGIMATGDHDPLKTDIAHIYVNVDDDLPVDRPRTKRYSTKTVDFKVNIQNHPTRWNLRISQIQCDGANLQAPQGCAQYYNQNKGNITSFNLLDGAYANNMDLALCIKRDPAACAIHYRIHSMGVGPAKGGASGKTQLGYGLTCEDYLIFNGERTALCGSVSSGPKDIILPVKGEQGLTFRTDSVHILKADTGFHIEYRYIHNCKGLEFYKYPTPGRKN